MKSDELRTIGLTKTDFSRNISLNGHEISMSGANDLVRNATVIPRVEYHCLYLQSYSWSRTLNMKYINCYFSYSNWFKLIFIYIFICCRFESVLLV